MAKSCGSNCLRVFLLVLCFSLETNAWFGSKATNPPLINHPDISCQDKPCKWIPNDTFSCTDNGCTEIPLGLGNDVEQINLSGNGVTIIPKLTNFTKLDLLNLAYNNISTIVDYAFEKCCHNMQTLLLQGNKLTNIEPRKLMGLDNLKYLYLQKNQLTEVPADFVYYHTLERLDLSTNQIKQLESYAFTHLKDLKYLHLQENKIFNIQEEAFDNLKSLEWLELMENKIETLYKDMFYGLRSLIHLDLNFNNISLIEEGVFNGLNNLKRLSLEHTKLTSLTPGMFKGLTVLGELYMGYNYFQEIQPDALPSTIDKLSLVYSHQLKKLENESLSGLPNLNEVYISDCHNLQEIQVAAFDEDTSIEVMDLSNNHLQTLPEDLLNWKQMVYLDLSGNPWDCDCHLEWMLEVNMQATTRNMIRCDTPLSTRGKFLSQLRYDEFRCGEDYSISLNTALATALVLFFTIMCLMALALFIYKCRQKVCPCFYTGTVGKYRAMYNTVDADADDESGVHFEKKPLPTNGVHSGTTV